MLGGLLAASGTALQASDDVMFKIVGYAIGAIGLLLLGGFAKDNNVTGGSVEQ